MIDPPERRRPEGRFGGLRQLRGFGGVGTRDWVARESLCGERGCAGEPVAREGGMCAGPEGSGGRRRVRRRVRRGTETGRSVEIFRNGPRRRGKFHQLFQSIDILRKFAQYAQGPTPENISQKVGR